MTSEDSSGESCLPIIDAGGGYIKYTLISPNDKISIDPVTGIITWPKNLPTDTFHLVVVASNGLLPNDTTEVVLVVTKKGVCSGHDGGLESKSLGFALSTRLYEHIKSASHTGMDYKKAHPFETLARQDLISSNQTSTTVDPIANESIFSNINLKDFMPDPIIFGKDAKGFISSPTDIINFTNAIDVMSVDYVQHGLNKAVAFATKSKNSVYTHTKPVCDRLKGSELIKVETMVVRNLSLLKYTVKPNSGIYEYATSFSLGINPQNGKLTLQSKWFTDQYINQDLMVNFQLWSYDSTILNAMVNNVISKFERDYDISQLGHSNMPLSYIQRFSKDENDQLSLKLTIYNNSNAATGNIFVKSRLAEFDSVGNQFHSSVKLSPFGITEFKLPIKDVAESEIRLLINGVQEDFIYYNDGLWNIHNPGNGTINKFDISTDTIKPGIDDFRLFRNVKLSAVTSDYITVYKMLRGGGMPLDLSDFNALKFDAVGNTPVRVRMLKKSIINYDEQYEYLLAFSPSSKTYQINLNQFKSSRTNKPINPDDILILSFTFEAKQPSSRIESSISNVRFVKVNTPGASMPQHMTISPNPVRSQFNISFQSVLNEPMTLQLIDISSGRILDERNLNVSKGFNNIQIRNVDFITASHCLVRLSSSNQIFQAKMIKMD